MSVTPLETCLLGYVWFQVDSDGIRPLYQSSFSHRLVNLDSYVSVVFMYSNVRDDTIIDNNSSLSTPGTSR